MESNRKSGQLEKKRMDFKITQRCLNGKYKEIIQDRYGLEESATETILTPPQYEEYSRVMLVPIFLMTLIPIQFGMWFKERQLRKSGKLIAFSKDFELSENPLVTKANKLMTGETTNEREEEDKFEYIIE
jgi:hypothetical protein